MMRILAGDDQHYQSVFIPDTKALPSGKTDLFLLAISVCKAVLTLYTNRDQAIRLRDNFHTRLYDKELEELLTAFKILLQYYDTSTKHDA